jgi:hypothetical protein
MAASRQWAETKPAVTDKIKDGPAEFQLYWRDIRERANIGGHVWDSVSALDKQGLHAVGASGVAGPDIYKSDMATKIAAWTDSGVTFPADYLFAGARNIPGSMLINPFITADAKGYKPAWEPFLIFESSPVDAKVNVKAGVTMIHGVANSTVVPFRYAGGFLTIGVAPLVQPAAGNHAYYVLLIDRSGVLTATKGTEVILANPPTIPDLVENQTPLAVIEIKALSVNFSLATSGNNAFLVLDARVDAGLTIHSGA